MIRYSVESPSHEFIAYRDEPGYDFDWPHGMAMHPVAALKQLMKLEANYVYPEQVLEFDASYREHLLQEIRDLRVRVRELEATVRRKDAFVDFLEGGRHS